MAHPYPQPPRPSPPSSAGRIPIAPRLLSLLLAALIAPPGLAQEAANEVDRNDPPLLGTTIVTAPRSPRTTLETPYAAEVISARRIADRSYRTTPQILRDVPGVMVQETAHGHGSPYIRGFTSLRTVFLIDGIRLNNSVFRPGPNQYWNSVDPLSLEQLEVIKGPSSVLFGSDAIGGTVGAITRSPHGYGDGLGLGERYLYRGSTAEHSLIGRVEASVTLDDRFGALLGVSGKTWGDLRAGDEVGTQANTGYDEGSADIKFERFLDSGPRLTFLHQRVRQYDVPRTHKTLQAESWEGTTVGSDRRRDFDQERDLTYLQLDGEEAESFFQSYHLSVSWHRQEEVRDRITESGQRELQGFEVGTLGMLAHFDTPTGIGRWTWGFDWYRDHVDSFRDGDPIQGPVADDATYDLLGVFVQDEIELGERLAVTLGARLQYAAADARKVHDPRSGDRISIDENWCATVASARFLWRIVEGSLHLFGGVSGGFRAPNLSDLSRFDSARSDEFEIPAPDLDPERTTTFEVGIEKQGEELAAQVAVFFTRVSDQIVRFPTGNTNDEGEFEITRDNVGDGHVGGIEMGAAWEFAPHWSVFGNATWLHGKVDTYPSSEQEEEREYLDRLMPPTAQLGFRWESTDARRWGEVTSIWADDADRLSTRDEHDTSRIPPGGTPGYLVFHLAGGWKIGEHAALRLALHNLTDEDYRIHGSGLNRPGRNLVFGLSYSR
jgi:hemoglobin/transferrin/lactoferrin receptor protein